MKSGVFYSYMSPILCWWSWHLCVHKCYKILNKTIFLLLFFINCLMRLQQVSAIFITEKRCRQSAKKYRTYRYLLPDTNITAWGLCLQFWFTTSSPDCLPILSNFPIEPVVWFAWTVNLHFLLDRKIKSHALVVVEISCSVRQHLSTLKEEIQEV